MYLPSSCPRAVVQHATLVELGVFLADLVGRPLQLRRSRQCPWSCEAEVEVADSMNSPLDSQHALLLMGFTFHETLQRFIALASGPHAGLVDVEYPFFIYSDDGVHPVEGTAA